MLVGLNIITNGISHEKAIEKSGLEFDKYKVNQSVIEKEASLKEIEADIKKLIK